MNNRVDLNQFRDTGSDLEKKKQVIELKKVEEQEQARGKGEAVPEGKVTTSQFADISTTTARSLIQIKTAIPFDPWPDQVTVDEIKVSIINIKFFGTEIVKSLLIKDITDVNLSKVPFFASLLFTGGEHKGFPGAENSPLGVLQINFLKPDEADRVKRIILGLIVFNDRKVDTSKIELSELLKQAEELGRARK